MFYLIFPLVIFYFLAKGYAKKSDSTYGKALTRTLFWSLIFCWASINGGAVAIWGRNQGSLFALPFWACYYFVGHTPGEDGGAYFYTAPSLWLTPSLPIAFYMVVFYLYKEDKAGIFKDVKNSIKPIAFSVVAFVVIMAIMFFIPTFFAHQGPLLGSLAIALSIMLTLRYFTFGVIPALVSIFITTLFLPYMLLFSSAPSVWAAVRDVLIPMGYSAIPLLAPFIVGLVSFFALNHITKSSKATPKSRAL